MSNKILKPSNAKLYAAQADMAKNVFNMMKQMASIIMSSGDKKDLDPEAKEAFQLILDYQVDLDHLKPQDILSIHQMYNNAVAALTKLSPKKGE